MEFCVNHSKVISNFHVICIVRSINYFALAKQPNFFLFINRSGYATRKCYPVMEVLQQASSLNYNQIRDKWYYASPGRSKPAIKVSNVPRNGSVLLHVDNLHPISNKTQKKTKINTLEEWLDKFIGTNPRAEYFKYLKLLWLDVKVPMDR